MITHTVFTNTTCEENTKLQVHGRSKVHAAVRMQLQAGCRPTTGLLYLCSRRPPIDIKHQSTHPNPAPRKSLRPLLATLTRRRARRRPVSQAPAPRALAQAEPALGLFVIRLNPTGIHSTGHDEGGTRAGETTAQDMAWDKQITRSFSAHQQDNKKVQTPPTGNRNTSVCLLNISYL